MQNFGTLAGQGAHPDFLGGSEDADRGRLGACRAFLHKEDPRQPVAARPGTGQGAEQAGEGGDFAGVDRVDQLGRHVVLRPK